MSHLPQPVSGNTVSVRPRELPGMPLPGKSASEIEFDNIRGKVAPQILFSCPACMTMLALKSGFQVSGNALPCPYCATAIMPPQLFVPQGNISSKTSNAWKIGERKDSKKMYRPPRDNANVVFLKGRPETAATSH